MYMNNLDPSMAQPTLSSLGLQAHVYIYTSPHALALSYFNTQFVMLTLGKHALLGPWGNTKETRKAPTLTELTGWEDFLGDKSEGSLGSTARTIACGKIR